MKLTDSISKLLHHHFAHYKSSYLKTEIKDFVLLLSKGILTKNSDETYSIDFDSDFVNEVLSVIAETLLSKSLPIDIADAFAYANEFRDALKTYAPNAPFNALSPLVKGFRSFVLKRRNENLDVYNFLLVLLASKEKRPNHLLNFEAAFLNFLPFSGYSQEIIFTSCCAISDTNKERNHDVYKFSLAIGQSNRDVAIGLYEYGLAYGIINYPGFAPNLLVGLYNSGFENAFSLAINLLSLDVIEGLKAFAGFDFKTATEVEEVNRLIEGIDGEANVINSKTWLMCKLVQNEMLPDHLKAENLQRLHEFVKSENHDIANAVFENVMYSLDEFEDDKYAMLISYLNNTKKFDVLEGFFYRVKSPKYLFIILVDLYRDKGFRMSLDRFENAIVHYWGESQTETEDLILELFEDRSLSFLAVKIMLCGHGLPLHLDVKKLTAELPQMHAVESLCDYPHSVEKLIPIALRLRNSKFKSVKTFLRQKLEYLIFNTYHESLFEIVKSELSPTSDKQLLHLLKKSLNEYKKMREFKMKVKDLDPRQNEQDLMDLYYRLEHESQAQMMKEGNNRGFLSALRGVTVVRGKAFKSDDDKQIVPLQLFQSSLLMNGEAYKNPIAFEQKLENL